LISKLNIYAELKPVNKQSNDDLVHLNRIRETNSLSHKTFDPGAQREMFSLQLLGPPLADYVLVGAKWR